MWRESVDLSHWAMLTLPIGAATLVVFARKLLGAALPPEAEVRRQIEFDRVRTSGQRFNPLRLWHSLLVSQLEGIAVGIGVDGPESVLDLNLDHFGDHRVDVVVDVDVDVTAPGREERALQAKQLDRVREALIASESTADGQTPLSDTWVGWGRERSVGLGLFSIGRTQLQLVNAADSSNRIVLEHQWVGPPLLTLRQVPLSCIVRHRDSASVSPAVVRLLSGCDVSDGETASSPAIIWMLQTMIARCDANELPLEAPIDGLAAMHLSRTDLVRSRGDLLVRGRGRARIGAGHLLPARWGCRPRRFFGSLIHIEATQPNSYLLGKSRRSIASDRAVGVRSR